MIPGNVQSMLLAREAATLAADGKGRCVVCKQVKPLGELVSTMFGRTVMLAVCPECIPEGGIGIRPVDTEEGKAFKVFLRQRREGLIYPVTRMPSSEGFGGYPGARPDVRKVDLSSSPGEGKEKK